jgi:hypothetical protein
MVAVTDMSPDATPAPAAVDEPVAAPARNIGVVPTASLLTGAAIATVWFWIPKREPPRAGGAALPRILNR